MSAASAIELRPEPQAGAWGVAVSGGADSVALLLLLSKRPALSLHVIHLDHQLRGEASAGDAKFAAELARKLGIPFTIALRQDLEHRVADLPANPSARWRALRIELFRLVVTREKLLGVALGHHADDQAETILMRLLRGKGPATAGALAGMSSISRLSGITVIRPLLNVRCQTLRDFLKASGQDWREDASNQSDRYARNRIRRFLSERQELHELVMDLGQACGDYARWVRDTSPRLEPIFFTRALARLPVVLGKQSARRWLIARGISADDTTPAMVSRLVQMAVDAARPPREQFAGGLLVRRRAGRIEAIKSRAS
jgi:tRNA(Ile)-lysidine synthetase-like protein